MQLELGDRLGRARPGHSLLTRQGHVFLRGLDVTAVDLIAWGGRLELRRNGLQLAFLVIEG